jgi:hypothetical protein
MKHIYHYGIVTGKFRLLHYDQWPVFRRIWVKIAQMRIIGELAGFLRAVFRGVFRLFNLEYAKRIKYLPGIGILDLFHTLGMIKAFRQYKYE